MGDRMAGKRKEAGRGFTGGGGGCGVSMAGELVGHRLGAECHPRALGLHHGLQVLIALSRGLGAGSGHPSHVAGGWQRRWLVHRERVGGRRNLDFGEVTGIHRAWRLTSTKTAKKGVFRSDGGWDGGKRS